MKAKTTDSRTMKLKSRPMAAALDAARDMADTGLINQKTMREYEALTLVPDLSAEDVARIRKSVNVSQDYFARSLNVSKSTVQQWESGAKRPSGSSAKLLAVVQKHGLGILA